MRDVTNTCKIALVQAEPVLFDKDASLAKALKYIEEAAGNNAELIVFPELFIPGYPIGMNFGFSMGKRTEAGREDWMRYYNASLIAGGPEFEAMAQAAIKAKAYISMGFSERDAVKGTLYNSNVIFEPDGSWKVHRKLKPTGTERVVWGDADKDYFPITETPWGPMGSLICWESYMPLARVALYQKGITIYISPNTNDNPEWQATIQHIAIEGKCYFINADMLVRKSSYPTDLNEKDTVDRLPDMVCRGGSCIIDPYGHYLTEPVWDEETIIYADLDMTLPAACKMEHDAVGHYARPDVLNLIVEDK
jgi:nitrilase